MRGLRAAFLASALVPAASGAQAGAWTLPQGHLQIIASTFTSRVTKSFDASGRPNLPMSLQKIFTGVAAEYGLLDSLTLIAIPQYVRATSAQPSGTLSESSASIEAGARVRLLDGFGVLSVQGTYQTAGAFGDTATDPFSRSGSRTDARLLYGWNYSLFGHPGFMEVEGGYRWNTGARPNEIAIDATAGLWVMGGLEVIAQSFTIQSIGTGRIDYGRYRNHKVELSVVGHLTRRTALQLGGFFSPDGTNTWQEQGLMVGFWYRL